MKSLELQFQRVCRFNLYDSAQTPPRLRARPQHSQRARGWRKELAGAHEDDFDVLALVWLMREEDFFLSYNSRKLVS